MPSCDRPVGRLCVRECLTSSGVPCGGPGGAPSGVVWGSPQGQREQTWAERLWVFGPSSWGTDELEEEQQPWLRVSQMQSRGFAVTAMCQIRLRKPWAIFA